MVEKFGYRRRLKSSYKQRLKNEESSYMSTAEARVQELEEKVAILEEQLEILTPQAAWKQLTDERDILHKWKEECSRFVTKYIEQNDSAPSVSDIYLAACYKRYAEAPVCEDHSGTGGTRSGCPYCVLVKLHAAISAIDLAFAHNEALCSSYDIHLDENAVVERVKKYIKA